jgi:hypothetical protein
MNKIIILERINEPSDFSFRFAMYATTPATRESKYLSAEKTSAVAGLDPTQLQLIKDGKIVESIETAEFLAGTTMKTIQDELIKRQEAFQAKVDATNPWKYYGTAWDGTKWTVTQTA